MSSQRRGVFFKKNIHLQDHYVLEKKLPIYFLLNVLCSIQPFQISNISPKRQKSKTQNFPKLLRFQE